VNRQINSVRRTLSALDRSLSGLVRSLRSVRASPEEKAPRRRKRLSPERRAALKLQGRYMGYMRQLKPRQKTIVRAVKAKSGTKAAIREALELAGKRKAA
jgi:hypothetical protein